MEYYIYNLISGEIRTIFSGPFDFVNYQLLESEDFLPKTDNYNDSTHYVDIETKTLLPFPLKPNKYSEFNWTTKQWEDPPTLLETARIDYKAEVNRLAGAKILSAYPTYRQINYNREPTAQATIEMNLWIDDIRAESNIATSSIDSATDLATIEGIVDGFTAYLAGL